MPIKQVVIDVVCIIAARVLLDAVYIDYVAPNYAYLSNFQVIHDPVMLAVSWIALLAMLPFVLSVGEEQGFTRLAVATLFIISYLPGTVTIAYQGVDAGFVACFVLYWLCLFAFSKAFATKASFKFPSARYQNVFVYSLIAVFVLGVVFVSWRYTGFRISFDLSDSVYDLRLEARQFDMPIVLEYVFDAAKVVLPMLVVYFLHSKRYLFVAALSLSVLLAFSVDGSKSTLFYFAMSVLCFLLVKRCQMRTTIRGFFVMVSISCAALYLLGASEGVDYLVRRIMFVPSMLNVEYYDFFSQNGIDYYRQSVFSKFGIESAYSSDIARMIGLVYHNSADMNANNGQFSDAFANLGVVGCLIMPLLIVALFNFIEAASKNLSASIITAIAIIVPMIMQASSFFTALLTHGVVFVCLAVYFLPRDYSVLYRRKRRVSNG